MQGNIAIHSRHWSLVLVLSILFLLFATNPTRANSPTLSASTNFTSGEYIYVFVDLGENVYPTAINNEGQVTGAILFEDEPYSLPFIWQNGTLQQFTNLPQGQGWDINDQGQIVGTAYIVPDTLDCANIDDGFRRQEDGTVTLLQLYPSSQCQSMLTPKINNSGAIAGIGSQFFPYPQPEPPPDGFYWRDGVFTKLGVLGGIPNHSLDHVGGINDAGQVVGTFAFGDQNGAGRAVFLWQDGSLQRLASHLTYAYASDINARGEVLLYNHEDSTITSYIWRDGELFPLPVTLEGNDSPLALNIHDQVLFLHSLYDASGIGSETQPDPAPQLINLHSLLPASAQGWQLTEAADINDKGWIVGRGVPPGADELTGRHGWLLRPLEIQLSGTVRDEGGKPAAGVTIALDNGRTTTTNSSGRYAFAELAPGTYTITPSAPDERFTPATRTVTLPPTRGGQDFRELVKIGGQLLDAEGEPVPDHPVLVIPKITNEAISVLTDQEGRYRTWVEAGEISTIPPINQGFHFSPTERIVDLQADDLHIDFQEKRPLLFVAGIAASRLATDAPTGKIGCQDELWPAPGFFFCKELLSLDPRDQDSVPPIYARDIVRKLATGSIYQPMMEFLTGQAGYVEYNVASMPARRTQSGCDLTQRINQPTLFVFAYDWRKSNRENALLLKDYVDCIRAFYPETQVDILAHSMGGLLSRRYMLDNPQTHGVGRLITINSPWLGATKAIYALYTGRFLDEAESWVVIEDGVLKKLAEFFAGAHELLPSRGFFTLGGKPIIEVAWDMNGDGELNQIEAYDDMVSILDLRFPRGHPGSNNQIFHDFPAQDDWRASDNATAFYHFFAQQAQKNTISSVITTISIRCSGKALVCSAPEWALLPIYGLGDGTVPTISARRSINGINLNSPEAHLIGFHSECTVDDVDSLYDHNGLLQSQMLFAMLLPLLRDNQLIDLSSVPTPECPQDELTLQTAQAEELQYYEIRITGQPSITIQTPEGIIDPEVTKTDSSNIESFLVGPNTRYVRLHADIPYTLTMSMPSDPIEIVVTESDDNTILATNRYQDVQLTVSSTLQVIFDGTDTVEILSDQDNDGTFEKEVMPTHELKGAEAQDIIPPEVKLAATPREDGKYEVSIEASDDETGVAAIYISEDGTTYAPYTEALTIAGAYLTTIYAFAEDDAGNRSDRYMIAPGKLFLPSLKSAN